jgi:RNA polymerase sigma-70 factor (ECF subfamily)
LKRPDIIRKEEMHIVNAAVLEQWSVLTDEQVVARVLTGQTALFEVLMRRHTERLYRTARAITGDDQAAEDVVLQAFLNAYGRLREFNPATRFATWLVRMVVHEARERVRPRERYSPVRLPIAVPREGSH